MTLYGRGHVTVALSILAWYVSSSLLIGSNKILFDMLKIDVPLLSTFIHFSLTAFALAILRRHWPDAIGAGVVSKSEFCRSVIPVAVTTALDVGLSNMAYSRLPISVMTVLKSSAPVCIYTTAVIAGVERFRWKISAICVVIAGSIALAVPGLSGEEVVGPDFVAGIIMIMVAVLSLSIRWILVQSLLRRYSPLQLLYLIQPTSALVLMPFAAVIELDSELFQKLGSTSLWLPLVLILGASAAAMTLLFTEYKIVHDTSSLTLSIAGIGKEILTLVLSVVIFGESFSTRQIVATSVSLLGIFVYAFLRSRERDLGYTRQQSEGSVGTKSLEEFELGDLHPNSPMSE